ncbi:estradiol 17-beta-dehydrogenase 2 [Thunnus albacares]|uniref:estradiol 17-beta-dehydrogenase 2 n=1 Tax=Thunnus albacares TaxID=8236 RepID=UPI001CF704F9|nr:estradiol 17-beta-dehydrogenase 2 [Thunnus albacares]
MDACFCVAAAAAFTYTVVWTLKQGCDAGYWSVAFGALGASLYFTAPLVYCGVALLCCSLALVCVTVRTAELLPLQGRAVLVTGCDSGFGHTLAKRLSKMGVQVFAGVLDVNGAGAQQLRDQGCENLQVLQLDVTDSSQIETTHLHIRAQVGDSGLWGLVNNAGILHCPLDAELHPVTLYRRVMDVNFLSAVKMCQVFLPLLRRSRGRIVNVSSMAGEVPMPMFAAYGASKAALSVFSKVMRLELSVWGVRVALIQPSGFRTNIFGNTDAISRYRDEILAGVSSDAREDYGEAYISSLPSSLTKLSQMSAEDLSPVVDNMCHALLSVQPRPLYTPGKMGWFLPFLHRHLPTTLFDCVIMNLQKYTDCEPAGLHVNSG